MQLTAIKYVTWVISLLTNHRGVITNAPIRKEGQILTLLKSYWCGTISQLTTVTRGFLSLPRNQKVHWWFESQKILNRGTLCDFFVFCFRCLYKYNWQKDTSEKSSVDSGNNWSHLSGCNHMSQTEGSSWSFLLQDKNYSSYSVMTLSPCRKFVVFGNLQGSLKLHDVGKLCHRGLLHYGFWNWVGTGLKPDQN